MQSQAKKTMSLADILAASQSIQSSIAPEEYASMPSSNGTKKTKQYRPWKTTKANGGIIEAGTAKAALKEKLIEGKKKRKAQFKAAREASQKLQKCIQEEGKEVIILSSSVSACSGDSDLASGSNPGSGPRENTSESKSEFKLGYDSQSNLHSGVVKSQHHQVKNEATSASSGRDQVESGEEKSSQHESGPDDLQHHAENPHQPAGAQDPTLEEWECDYEELYRSQERAYRFRERDSRAQRNQLRHQMSLVAEEEDRIKRQISFNESKVDEWWELSQLLNQQLEDENLIANTIIESQRNEIKQLRRGKDFWHRRTQDLHTDLIASEADCSSLNGLLIRTYRDACEKQHRINELEQELEASREKKEAGSKKRAMPDSTSRPPKRQRRCS